MKKIGKKQLMIAGAGIVTILVLYGLYRMLRKEKENTDDQGLSKASNPVSSLFKGKTFPLKRGSKGKEVKILQRILNKGLRPPRALLVVDGIFGSKTEAASLEVLRARSVSRELFDREKSKHPDLIF